MSSKEKFDSIIAEISASKFLEKLEKRSRWISWIMIVIPLLALLISIKAWIFSFAVCLVISLVAREKIKNKALDELTEELHTKLARVYNGEILSDAEYIDLIHDFICDENEED